MRGVSTSGRRYYRDASRIERSTNCQQDTVRAEVAERQVATILLEMLKEWGIERVIVTGMMTHMCVDATARAASDLGFKVIIAEDACATRDLKYGDTTIPADHVHKAFLAALKSYGEVMRSEEVIALLAGEIVNQKS